MAFKQEVVKRDVRAQVLTNRYPKIDDAIKNTIDHQIKKHQSQTPRSAHRILIARTNELLSCHIPAEITVRTISNRPVSRPYGQCYRGKTAVLRSKRSSRLQQTKRQLQMLNQLYKSQGNEQIKRYQQQLQQEQIEIHNVVTNYRLKRKWGNSFTRSTHRTPKSRLDKPPHQNIDRPHQAEQAKPKESLEEREVDSLFKKMHPYRRILISQRKSRGSVQPWQSLQPN